MGPSFIKSFMAGLILYGMLAAAYANSPADARMAVPDAPSQAAARKLVRDVFKSEYAALTPAGRAPLARRLMQQAGETNDDPAARFVMFNECIDMAMSNEPTVAMLAAGRLAALYQVDELECKSSALLKGAGTPRKPASAEAFARCCLDVWNLAIGRDDYDIAARMLFLAENAARDARKPDLVTLCADRRKDMVAIKGQFEESRSAAAVLAKTADDAKANLAMGRFLCLVKGDWAKGLPHLALGSDLDLRAAARADLADPTEGGDRVAAGNPWWDLAEKSTGIVRRNLLQRAGTHYRAALATSYGGIHKASAQQRLALIDEQRLKDLHLVRGLRAEMFDDAKLSNRVGTRTDTTIDFNWGLEGAATGLPKDNFSIRWSGQLIVPRKGQYAFLLNVNSGARLFVGGKMVLEEANGAMKRNGVRIDLPLDEGFVPIRVEYWDGGGEAKIHLQWQPPGGTKEAIVPESVLCHDPGEAP